MADVKTGKGIMVNGSSIVTIQHGNDEVVALGQIVYSVGSHIRTGKLLDAQDELKHSKDVSLTWQEWAYLRRIGEVPEDYPSTVYSNAIRVEDLEAYCDLLGIEVVIGSSRNPGAPSVATAVH